MYLKKLELQGFKSFADKTIVDFNKGITGIVGPNGSGKSNISDAIRWVLGEQNVKSLRGDKMKSVIFSGSSDRKANSYAKVSMVLDNTNRTYPLEYDEIIISRKIYRDGENEYLLNNKICRLKDVREVLIETGLGKDGYSIISQGKIDEILSAKSEERRSIFEEATGIIKYKFKKEDSEKKLAKTEENILRIDDIFIEVDRQVGPLEKQSTEAKEYMKIMEELKHKEKIYFKLKIDNKKEVEKRIIEEKKELSKKKKIDKDSFDELNQLKNKAFSSQNDIEEKGIEIKKENIEDLKMKEKYMGEKNLLKEKDRNSELNLKKHDENIIEINSEIEKLNSEIKKNTDMYDESIMKLNKVEKDFIKKQNTYKSQAESKSNYQQGVEELKEEMLRLLNEKASINSKVKTLDVNIEALDRRKKQINGETNDIGLLNKTILLDLRKQKDYIKEITANNCEYEEHLNKINIEFKDKANEINHLENELTKKKSTIESNISRLNFYKNVIDDYEGYFRSVKNFILDSKKTKSLNELVEGTVAEKISVKKEHEKAIEVALGGALQNIIVGTPEDAKICIEYLKEKKYGRITFLPMNSLSNKYLNNKEKNILNNKSIIGLASDIIDYDSKYSRIFSYLLGRVIIVKDIDSSIKLSREYGNTVRMVTLEGDVLNAGGSMTGGFSRTDSIGLIGREDKIESLEHEIKNEKKLYENEKTKCINLIKKRNVIEESILNVKENINKNEMKENAVNISIKNNEERLEENNKRLELFKKEENQIGSQIKENQGKLEDVNLEIVSNKNRRVEIDDIVGKSKNEVDDYTSNIDLLSKEITSMEVSIGSMSEKNKNLKRDLERMDNELVIRVKKTENLVNDKKTETDNICVNKLNISNIEKEIVEINIKIEQDNRTLELVDIEKQKLKEQVSKLSIQMKKLERSVDYSDKEELKKNLEIEKIDFEKQSLRKQMWNEYEVSYSMLIDLEIDKNIDLKIIEKDILNLKKEAKGLGSVNIESIEEYKTVKERHAFLGKQRSDLIEGKKQIISVIEILNRDMKELFSTNFEKIRINFKEIFLKLFGGGEADIFLENEQDILNSGIEILAQPPGKKLQTLSLLSGGERTLIAISILFAILKTKPTPFCILDEIEAALDDSNLYRYINYLKEFSKETQFIVITHRKETMEETDYIYGVTMQNDGISKLMSIKIKEFKE